MYFKLLPNDVNLPSCLSCGSHMGLSAACCSAFDMLSSEKFQSSQSVLRKGYKVLFSVEGTSGRYLLLSRDLGLSVDNTLDLSDAGIR